MQVKPLLQLFQRIGLSEQFGCFCNSLIGRLYLFAVDLSCLVQLVFFFVVIVVAASLKQTLAFQLQRLFYKKEYEQTHAFLADRSILMKKKKNLASWLKVQAEIIE